MPGTSKKDKGGEGNVNADRRYRERTREFVKSGEVETKAEEARPDSESEARALKEAEKEGKRRAKEEDPAIKRNYVRKGSKE